MEKYLYSINNNVLANELCEYEMECIFGEYNKFIITNVDVASNKSVFIKDKMYIHVVADSIDNLIAQIVNENHDYGLFKLTYIKNPDEKISYEAYINNIKEIADKINGEGEFKNPHHILAIAYIDKLWYFGKYEKNDYSWQRNNDKPYSYSNAMSADLSHSIINIAMATKPNVTIIDPCCGVGTVVIDGMMQGANIKGTEINPQIGTKAQKNLSCFDFPSVITIADMHDIQQHYDVSILDIPYGIMSHTDVDLQQGLISGCYKISDKLILVASDKLSDMVIKSGYNIVKNITIKKHNNAKFNRYITICEK